MAFLNGGAQVVLVPAGGSALRSEGLRVEGHPSWYLTFMANGKKHVERIPAEWVAEVQRRVNAGRAFKEAVAEVFAANAELLVLWHRQTGQ